MKHKTIKYIKIFVVFLCLLIFISVINKIFLEKQDFIKVIKSDLNISVGGEATILAEKSHSIFSQTDGIIISIEKQNGDTISKNDVVLILENDLAKSEYDKLLIEKNILETKIINSNHISSTNVERMKVAKDDLSKTFKDFKQAKEDFKLGAISQKSVDEYEMISKKLKINVLDLEANINQIQIEIKTLALNLREINRQIELAKKKCEHLTIRAKMEGEFVNMPDSFTEGVLLLNNTQIGEIIGSKKNAQVKIDNNLREKIKVGDQVFYYYQNNVITGSVIQIQSPIINNETGKIELPLICSISQELPYLIKLPAKIFYQEKKNVNTVPIDYIYYDNDLYYVWLKKYNRFIKKYIKILALSEDKAEVNLPIGSYVYKN